MAMPMEIWTKEDSAAAVAQGYDLFATLLPECRVEVMYLQCDDDRGAFADDREALRHVMEMACRGDPLALKALYLANAPTTMDALPFPP